MRRASILAVVLLACTVTGCGSTGSSDSPDASVSSSSGAASPSSSHEHSSAPASSSASSSASTSASTSASPSESPSAAPATSRPPSCTTAGLRVSVSGGDGAMGSAYFRLRITNTSAHACRTGGFGGVSLVSSSSGKPIGAPADRTRRGQARPILLAAGERADATLRVVHAEDYPVGRCHPVQAKGFRVYPPNETHSAFVRHPVTACHASDVHLLSLTPYKKSD